MDVIIAKKFKLEIRLLTIIIILCLLLIGSIVFVSYNISKLQEEADRKEQEIKKYRKIIGTDVNAVIELKDSLKFSLARKYKKIESAFKKENLNEIISTEPLFFKQQLFDVQEDIRKRAKRNNVLLPEGLGFEEYKLKVPDALKSSVLMSELLVLEQICGILIDNRVHAINNIQFHHEQVLLKKNTENGESVFFKSLSINLSVEMDFAQMKKFIVDLSSSDKIYAIWQIDVKRKDNSDKYLIADINIKSIKL